MKHSSPVPMTVFSSTFHKFTKLALEGNNDAYDAFALFVYFFECFVRQGRKRVYCTERFGREHTGLSESKYRRSKQLLRKMGLISLNSTDQKHNKKYFSIFLNKDESDWIDFEEWRKTEGYIVQNEQGGYCSKQTNNSCTEKIILKQKTKISSKEDIVSSPPSKKRKVIFVKNGKICPVTKRTTPNPVQKENPVPKKYSKIIVPGNNPIPADLDKMSADAFKKGPPGTKYQYVLADIQLYNELLLAGATNHRKDTQAYFNTMDSIHLLLSNRANHPYCASKFISDDYKKRDWTHEEVVEVFKFYLKHTEKKPVRGVSNFIYTPSFGESKSFSLLCIFHKKMIDGSYETLDGDAKRLNQELERMNLGNVLDARDLKSIVSLVGVHCNGYKLPKHHPAYFDRHIYAFTEFIESKIRIPSFKVGYIRGEKFVQQFVQEYKQRGILS